MVMVVEGNVLHHVKREGEMSGGDVRGAKCPALTGRNHQRNKVFYSVSLNVRAVSRCIVYRTQVELVMELRQQRDLCKSLL